jgi:hypothetical protein
MAKDLLLILSQEVQPLVLLRNQAGKNLTVLNKVLALSLANPEAVNFTILV